MREIITSCTCDCPDTCSILARVEGGRVARIRGNPDFEVTRGFLCRKSRGFLKRVFSKDRILHPLRRDGTTWRRISWDEAADSIAQRVDQALRTHGPLGLYYFRDAGSIAALKHVNERFFNLLGGATFASGSLCGGPGIAGQTADFGYRTSHAPLDILNSKIVLIWGRNPAWTNVHLVPILREARRRGTKIVLIDPIRTASAKLADWHISPIPGSDVYLGLGMIRALCIEQGLKPGVTDEAFLKTHTAGHEAFLELAQPYSLQKVSEVTGLTTSIISQLAYEYGHRKPASILGGWGLQLRRNGATVYRVLDALGALTGNIGVSGGGVSHGMDEARWFDRKVCLRHLGMQRREIPRPATGKGLLEADDPPVAVAFISGANPLNQCPNTAVVEEAFGRVGFVVVMDMFMTDTARVADIVLPTTHFLQERDMVGSYWHNYVMPVNVAQTRLGEEKTDLETFAFLAERLGLGSKLPDSPDYYLEQMIEPLKGLGLDLENLMKGPTRPATAVDVPFADMSFPTPSSKFEFVTEIDDDRPADSADFPYHLLSPHPHDRTHSQLAGEGRSRRPEALVSPRLARSHGLEEGDAVTVSTAQGTLECRILVSGNVRPDTVVIYEGWWESLGGSVNRLTSDVLSDMGLGATYNDVRCGLRRSFPGTERRHRNDDASLGG